MLEVNLLFLVCCQQRVCCRNFVFFIWVEVVPGYFPGMFVEPVQAASCADPNHSTGILGNGQYKMITERIGISRVIPVGFKIPAVKAIQPILGTQPKQTIAVLENAVYTVLGKALRCIDGNKAVINLR